jgi:hypothetical protein
MNLIDHINIVCENMIREFLELIAEECDLDIDELVDTYIEAPKKENMKIPPYIQWIQESSNNKKQLKGIIEKPIEYERQERCCARVLTEQRISGLNRDQCLSERKPGSVFCKRHQKKRPHGEIISPVLLMKAHDFKKKNRYFPILVKGVTYMYEPFSQRALRVSDNRLFYIHSNNGKNVEITKKKEDNCIYIIRWHTKINSKNYGIIREFKWNMTTNNITTLNDQVLGTYIKLKGNHYKLDIQY